MTTPSPRVLVTELRDGNHVDAPFRLKTCLLRTTPQGSPFLLGEVQDRSGSIGFVCWSPGAGDHDRLRSSRYVRLSGKVSIHKDRLQLVAQSLAPLADDQVDPGEFSPQPPCDLAAVEAELRRIVDEVEDEWIRELLRRIFVADERIARRFREAPAAVAMHHAWIGGLMAHSVAVARLALAVADRYPDLDRSLLVAGALLHDVCKIDELQWRDAFSYTSVGNLVGHVVLGAILVQEKARDIAGFPPRTLEKLQHLVVSHHGELQYGAAKEPMLREAIVLHHIDNIDAKLEAFDRAVAGSTSQDDEWTEPIRMFGRRLYKGP